MKTSSLITAILVFSGMLLCSQVFAQSTGIAADKKKQENLNKTKAHQAELKKKYNSLTPEQAAEAKRRANEYKRGGYKDTKGKGAKTTTGTSAAPAAASKPVQPAVSSAKPAAVKPAGTQNTAKPAPVMMDANGKPLNKTTAKAATVKPAATPVKPEVAPQKTKVVPTTSAHPKTTVIKTAPATGKTPAAAETKKK